MIKGSAIVAVRLYPQRSYYILFYNFLFLFILSSLLSLQSISKSYGDKNLFSDLSFSLLAGDRVGIIGPNGSGKSSLLKILTGAEDIDSGLITKSRGLVVHHVQQTFDDLDRGSIEALVNSLQNPALFENYLDQLLFYKDLPSKKIGLYERMQLSCRDGLSGGQKKKIQLALLLSQDADILLLDEPSNHLDIDSIQILESLLSQRQEAIIMISHDRWLLETFSDRIIEINKILPQGYYTYDGSYEAYLEKRAEYIEALDRSYDTLKNKVRTEVAWLRQGAKARTTKSKHRTASAQELIKTLSTRTRMRSQNAAEIQFSHSGRKTKELLSCEKVRISFDGQCICKDVSFTLTQGSKLAILGSNGSGKTTLLKLLLGECIPDSGTVVKASNLSISYFSQISDFVDPKISLSKALHPDSDTVVYNGNSLHIVSWAKKFGFDAHALHQPYESLSGGEKAKVRIARLLLENPDVLLLDEPTNDLDIDTLEVLEESLIQFKGAVIIISHDRYMLTKVCDSFLGLIKGQAPVLFSSYDQWVSYLSKKSTEKIEEFPVAEGVSDTAHEVSQKTKKRSYKEQREYEMIQKELEIAEEKHKNLSESLSYLTDSDEIRVRCEEIGTLQREIDRMYKRWEELEDM